MDDAGGHGPDSADRTGGDGATCDVEIAWGDDAFV